MPRTRFCSSSTRSRDAFTALTTFSPPGAFARRWIASSPASASLDRRSFCVAIAETLPDPRDHVVEVESGREAVMEPEAVLRRRIAGDRGALQPAGGRDGEAPGRAARHVQVQDRLA